MHFYADALSRIKALHPATIVITDGWRGFAYTKNGHEAPGSDFATNNRFAPSPAVEHVWQAGLKKTLAALKTTGANVVVLGDIAYPNGDGAACVSAHQHDLKACYYPPADAVYASHNKAEARTARSEGASYVSTTQWFCTRKTCDPVVGKYAVYRDSYHITGQYALWLSDAIGEGTGLLHKP